MNDHRLRRLLSDAVSDIEPDDRLEELRASVRTGTPVVRLLRPRPWYAAAGIVAAVIVIVAYVTSVAGDNPTNAGPATGGDSGMPSATATATDTAAPSPPDATNGGPSSAVAVYYLGSGPRGTVLYREVTPAPASGTPLEHALAALMREPADPDYRTPWRAGWLHAASTGTGVIQVDLGDVPETRPPSMTGRDASEAVQQVVYTLQAALQRRDPVVFTRNGDPAGTVLGVPTSLPVAQGPPLDVLSRMSITDPAEGQVLPRGRLVITGANNSFEATVVVQLKRGGRVYATKAGIASGYLAERLFPWRMVVNTSNLRPGRYTLVASTDDPSGRNRQETDSRVIELE